MINELETANKQSLEYELKEDDIVYFLHIPKTAGTTLTTIIYNNFDLNSIYPEQVWQKLLLNKPKSFSEYKLIRGHFGHSLRKILPKKPVYITMIRDPVERTISFYHHMRTDPFTNNWVKEFISKNEDLDSLISDPKKRMVFANEQTRHIGLELDVVSLTESLKSKIEDFFYESSLPFTAPDIADDKLIETAKRNLSEFTFVGLTERFEESLMLLCYTFGWRPIRKVWNQMVLPNRPSRSDFSEKTINTISECTKLDLELYHHARQIFESRFSQMVRELKERYYKPHFTNMPFHDMIYEMLEEHHNQRFGISKRPMHSIDFDFSQGMSGTGWYPRERLPDGTTIRWMGIEPMATIDFSLAKDRNLKIQFCVGLQMAHDILESIRLDVNENPISLKILRQENGRTVFEGIIPKSNLQNEKNFTRLIFQVNRTISPRSVDPASKDERLLGLAFLWISISPID